MDKFSYAIGLGIGQNLLSMGAKGIKVDDFAQAIKDILEGNKTAISHAEARDIVNKYFAELEEKICSHYWEATMRTARKHLQKWQRLVKIQGQMVSGNTGLSLWQYASEMC